MSIKNEKIAVRENKFLKLNNVLIRQTQIEEYADFNKTLHFMENYIKSKGLSTYGPLIVHSSIENIAIANQPSIKIKLMLQLNQTNPDLKAPYEFEPSLRIGPCLYSRFKGNMEDIQFAQNKLGVIAYENDIFLKSESYIVYIEQNGNEILADTFIPIKEI